MARECEVTGKRAQNGYRISHAHNKTKRKFQPNLHKRRLWVDSENRWVALKLSQAGLRTIDKKGIDVVLAKLRERGEKI